MRAENEQIKPAYPVRAFTSPPVDAGCVSRSFERLRCHPISRLLIGELVHKHKPQTFGRTGVAIDKATPIRRENSTSYKTLKVEALSRYHITVASKRSSVHRTPEGGNPLQSRQKRHSSSLPCLQDVFLMMCFWSPSEARSIVRQCIRFCCTCFVTSHFPR